MSVGDLFDDAQKSTHGHKSLAKRLRKLEAKFNKNNRSEEFENHVKACVVRLFEVAKSEPAGGKVVKFLNTFFGTPLSKDPSKDKNRDTQQRKDGHDDNRSVPEEEEVNARDPTEVDGEEKNAVANAILIALLPYLSAKDKTVRYRATQIVSSILSSLDAIDDDLYKVVRHELMKRLRDRVPAIRLEAVMVLGPLVEGEIETAETTRLENGEEREEEDSDYDDESAQASGLLEKLLDVLCNDTNADVRRALLVNLPVSSETLPYLLERARDKDAATRRAFYLKLCLEKLGDFRHLSVSMREKLLRWGLRDRDEKVRKAAAKMFREKWIEDCAKSHQAQTDEEQNDKQNEPRKRTGFYEPSVPALLELLERIDVINSGSEDGVALEAMKEFWTGRPDYVEEPAFGDDFWQNLSAESAFMARTWNDYCQANSEFFELIENRMPEVTRFGYLLQHQINQLTSMIEANKAQEEAEEDTTEQEFIVEQMLHVAHTLDFTDEIGRRKMFGLFRNAITMPDFPDECTKLAVEALRLTCTSDAAGEREFTSVILEAISEVHDTVNLSPEDLGSDPIGEEDSFVSAQSELSQSSSSTTQPSGNKSSKNRSQQQAQNLTEEEQEAQTIHKILVELKCLNIAQSMLQNVSGQISSNVHLESLLESLILPCVRSHDAPVREKGLECLGLCCLLEPSMASENYNVFVHCLKRGDENLKIVCLQILCDLLLTAARKNQADLLSYQTSQPASHSQHSPSKSTEPVLDLDLSPFTHSFKYEPQVQATATQSLAKLMLCGFYSDSHIEEFDAAVENAELGGVKGWEVLAKVRTAVQPVGADSGEPTVGTSATTTNKGRSPVKSSRRVGSAGE